MVTISAVYHTSAVGRFPKMRSKTELLRFQQASDARKVYFLSNLCSGDRSDYIYWKLFFLDHRSLNLYFFGMSRSLIFGHKKKTVWNTFGTLLGLFMNTFRTVCEQLEDSWKTPCEQLEDSWKTVGEQLGQSMNTLGTVHEHFWTVERHSADCPPTVHKLFQKCSQTVPKVFMDSSKSVPIFWLDFRNPWIWSRRLTKIFFFNILILSNIPEKLGSVGTRIEQYWFSLLSTANELTLKKASEVWIKKVFYSQWTKNHVSPSSVNRFW